MITVSLLCSLYAWKGDKARVFKTLEWYDALCEGAGYNFRLLLVNDCSDESFDDIIPYITTPKGYCTEVQYFKSKVRLGKALQLNRLLVSCDDDYVGIIDNDVICPYEWLTQCMVIANTESIAVCGVMVEDLPLLESRTHKSGILFDLPQQLGGACLLWKSSKLGVEEYFWQKAGVYGHEDAEFVRRISNMVGRVACLAQKGLHLFPASEGPEVVEDSTEYRAWKKKCLNSTTLLLKNRIDKL
tara:strand:+ start:21567 stop:22295 length:729 start_codon:yes stop_codon:yes gene_type:complete